MVVTRPYAAALLLITLLALPVSAVADPCEPDSAREGTWTTRTGCVTVPLDYRDPAGGRQAIYYEMSEPDGDPLGNLIVFHGGPAYPRKHLQKRSYMWRTLRSHFRVLYFHQRGSGYSGRVETREQLEGRRHLYTLEAVVGDTDILHRQLLAGKPAVLMGKSAGGFVALKYALKYPARIQALILAATSPHHGYISRRTGVKGEFFRTLDQRYPGFRAAHVRAHEVLAPGILEEIEPLKEFLLKVDLLDSVFFDLSYTLDGQFEIVSIARDVAARRFELLLERISHGRKTLKTTGMESVAVLNNITCREFRYGETNPGACAGVETAPPYDVRGELGRLEMPVLVLSGRYDPILPPRFQKEIVDALNTDVRWHILELSAHMLFQEQPRATAIYVLEFLDIPFQQPSQAPGL